MSKRWKRRNRHTNPTLVYLFKKYNLQWVRCEYYSYEDEVGGWWSYFYKVANETHWIDV